MPVPSGDHFHTPRSQFGSRRSATIDPRSVVSPVARSIVHVNVETRINASSAPVGDHDQYNPMPALRSGLPPLRRGEAPAIALTTHSRHQPRPPSVSYATQRPSADHLAE